jgi:anti-sigma regulatory factor (Ser/Thr protein kinase)
LSCVLGMNGSIAPILELSLAPTPKAPALARAAVSDWLAQQSNDGVILDVVLLLVSELVTNSVRHARMAEEPLRLTAWVGEATVRFEIWDSGSDGTVARREPRRDNDLGGFGLELVTRLSSAWGVERDVTGTTVWLEVTTAG